MADTRRDRTGEMVSINRPRAPTTDPCPSCTDADPVVRTKHHLALAKQGGLDLLRPHLEQYYGQRLPADERRGSVEQLCRWIGHVMQLWSGLADHITGAPLPWWEARTQAMQEQESDRIARYAYDQAPEAYKARFPYKQRPAPAVPGFTRVRDREPGEEG